MAEGPGFDTQRLLRIAFITAVLLAGFMLLQPYGLGWAVIPAGLGVAVLILLAAMFRNHLAKRKLAELRRELEEMKRREESE